MSQSVNGIHTTAIDDARRHGRHRTRVRSGPGAPRRAMTGLRRGSLAPTVLLIAAALIMIATPVYVTMGEKGIAVSPSLWKVAIDFCRVVTGLVGLLTIGSAVNERRSVSSGDGTLGSLAGGVVLIAAAVAGLGLVIVMTGLIGLGLLFAGGAVAVDAFRPSRPEPGLTPPWDEGAEPFRDPRALTGAQQ